MSQLEAGQLTLRRSVFALRPLLTNAIQMMRPLAAQRGIALRPALDPAIPHLLFGDPVRMRQVLLNLLSNAAKYAAPGEVLLIAENSSIEGDQVEDTGTASAGTDGSRTAGTPIERRRTDGTATDAGKRLRLAVRDQGPAIPEAERARLFQPFSQLDQPGAEVQPGSGLGLAICRLLATLMGGTVGYETVELNPMGQPRHAGNEFWISLPVEPLPADAVAPADRPAALPALPRSRILLVEDVAVSRLVVARLLRRVGHMVDTAASGEAALAAVSQRPYDVVLMDVHMPGLSGPALSGPGVNGPGMSGPALSGPALSGPGLSGIDTARQIRMLPGAAGAVPIIALTAATSPEETVQCRAAGMNGLVTKPAPLADLLAAIGRHAWPGRIARPAKPAMAAASQSAGAPDIPVLAAARLDELRRHLEPGILGKLAEDSVIDLQQRLPTLRDALGSADTKAIVMVAHTMAGVAAGYGMAALEARLRAVIVAAHLHDHAAAMSRAEDLEAVLAQAAVALRSSLRIEVV
jgi:CheY-like chemotaxis protein